MSVKRIVTAIALVAAVVAFFFFDLGQYMTLSYVKSRQADFTALYAQNATAVLSVYFLVYVATTALSLPGAVVLTLVGGALFGFWTALVVISFASTIGATVACLVARFILGDVVQRRLGGRLDRINRGIEREGAFYLFTMRLIPAIPFFVINLGMGLTTMPLRTFYWVSQLGMLPGTMVYVNAGKELGQLSSLAGILSPGLIASFVLLGVFPLAAKKVMRIVRRWHGLDNGLPRPGDSDDG